MHRLHSFAALSPVTFLERSGRAFPNRQAIVHPDGVITFSELVGRARRLTQALTRFGVKRGDKIAVLSENSPQVIEIHFGVPAVGGVLVMLNPWLPSADITYMLAFCEAKVLIVEASFLDKLSDADKQQLTDLKQILVLGEVATASTNTLSYEQCLIDADDRIPLDVNIEDELDPLTINFTSGTTGRPKGVMCSHRAAYLNALGQSFMLSLGRGGRYLWSLPMFHVNGWGHIWTNVAVGSTQVVLPGRTIRGKEASLIKLIPEYGITHLCGAPRLVRALTESPDDKSAFAGITITTGGAAPSPDLISTLEAMQVHFIHQYGLNETLGPYVVCEEQEDWLPLSVLERAQKRARQGIATLHAGTGLRVVDDAMQDVAQDGNTLGEVVMSGNTVALGYYKNPEATEKAFKDGWFHSGDMAVVHPDGYLEIRDRIKDLIYVETDYGWENISSSEIENALCRYQGVRDAAVISVAAEATSAALPVLVAFVEPYRDQHLTAESLFEQCARELAIYKRPQRIFLSELPKTATGKVRKDLLVTDAINRLQHT